MGIKRSFYSVRNFVAKLLVCVMLSTTVMAVPNVYAKQTVSAPKISKTSKDIVVGGTYDLNIKNKVNKSTYKWSTSNKKVATVSKVGVVKGIKKGKVTITCNVKTPKSSYKLTSKITVREGATAFEINNKVTALTVGQKYNLNRDISPITSNDLTAWSSSDQEIAKPDSKGKFTALKEGTVTITGKTLSGKTDSVKIIVFDQAGTVTTQEELDAILGSNIRNILIKTDDAATFEIAEGSYEKQNVVIDAPNADVVNKGLFKSIEVKQIKATTWYENAIGNTINVSAPNARIRIEANASAAIVVNNEGVNLNLINNGSANSSLVLNANATVNISGTSTQPLSVVANSNATVTASTPLSLTCNSRIQLNLQPGAENTVVNVSDETFIPVNTGSVSFSAIVGSGSGARTVSVAPANNSNTSGGGGSSYVPSPVTYYGSISGKITVADSVNPVSGAAIYLLKATGSDNWEPVTADPDRVTITNDDGEYYVSELTVGDYMLAARKTGFEDYNANISVTLNTITTLDFSMNTSSTPVVPSNKGILTGRVLTLTPLSGGAIDLSGSALTPVSGDALTPISGSAIAVPGATIYALKYEGDIAAAWDTIMTSPNAVIAASDENGIYRIAELEAGNYVVAIAKEGYRVLNQLARITENATTIVNGTLIALSEDGDTTVGIASGNILNALTGRLVDRDLTFTVNVYNGFDNTTDLVTVEAVSGAAFSLNLPEGYYTIQVDDDRAAEYGVTFATTTMNVIVLGGTIFNNQDIVLATLKEAGQATFVLTWGQYPTDLDSHLVGPVSDMDKYHIFYLDMTYPDVYEDISDLELRLDVDDITSYGPETTSIYVPVENGIYTFFVFNYSSNYEEEQQYTLVNSDAKVVVTTSRGNYTFNVPNGADETTWVVCSYNSNTGDITPINILIDNYEEYFDLVR